MYCQTDCVLLLLFSILKRMHFFLFYYFILQFISIIPLNQAINSTSQEITVT